MSERVYHTTIVHKYPSFRDDAVTGCWKWLKGRRADDNAEKLWRVHDKLYDLKDFAKVHPGGKEWLTLTEGTDVTEAFESYHITDKASQVLPKFFVRDASEPRNYKFTFNEDGFYRTLKRRAAKKLESLDRRCVWKSKLVLDLDLILVFLFAIVAGRVESLFHKVISIFLCAQCSAWLLILSHNFIHQRNNWRMYTACLVSSSWRDWRVFHAIVSSGFFLNSYNFLSHLWKMSNMKLLIISHHSYPNTYSDYEIRLLEPFFRWIPIQKKTRTSIIMSYILTPLVYSIAIYGSVFQRWSGYFLDKRQKPKLEELMPLLLPASMILFGNLPLTWASVLVVVKVWNYIIILAFNLFAILSLNAAHHGPHLIHEGDDIKELDFGIYQLSAVSERVEVNSNLLFALTHFGHHTLHHMFPSLDHSLLPQLEGILLETCEEFKETINEWTILEGIKGSFQQMGRTKTIRLKRE